MKSNPEVIELDEADLESKLDQIEAAMGAEMAQPFRLLLRWYARLLGLLREKKLSIRQLQKMLFGASTERTSSVLSSAAESSAQVEGHVGARRRFRECPSRFAPAAQPWPDSGQRLHRLREGDGDPRVAAPGDACPHCMNGTVYRQTRWSPVVRLKGQPPVTGQVYQLERLRCGDCGHIFTAELPEEAGPEKYDPSVAATIGTLRYGEGMPWNRLQRLQESAGVPLPASDQWEQVRDAAERGPRDAYRHLAGLAAQGDLMHNDDTTMRVLELMEKNKRHQPLLEEDPERRGVFTTGIVSMAQGRPDIVLFFTGPHHAGENLRMLLEARSAELPPPIQMCDALSRNMPDRLRVIIANCLAHGRRNFVERGRAVSGRGQVCPGVSEEGLPGGCRGQGATSVRQRAAEAAPRAK